MFRFLARISYALVFPLYCPACGQIWEEGRGWLCPRCWENLPAAGLGIWARNRNLRRRVMVAFAYDEVTRELVHQMKFQGRVDIAEEIGAQTAKRIQGELDGSMISCVVPVPLHPVRLRERGFDQNLVIAREIAAGLSLPLRADLIRRTRNRPPQSRLSNIERLSNLQDAFAPVVSSPKPVPEAALLVDDVIHTGATAAGCMEALKRAGIKQTMVVAAFG